MRTVVLFVSAPFGPPSHSQTASSESNSTLRPGGITTTMTAITAIGIRTIHLKRFNVSILFIDSTRLSDTQRTTTQETLVLSSGASSTEAWGRSSPLTEPKLRRPTRNSKAADYLARAMGGRHQRRLVHSPPLAEIGPRISMVRVFWPCRDGTSSAKRAGPGEGAVSRAGNHSGVQCLLKCFGNVRW